MENISYKILQIISKVNFQFVGNNFIILHVVNDELSFRDHSKGGKELEYVIVSVGHFDGI